MARKAADQRVALRRQASLERKRQALAKTAGHATVAHQQQSLAAEALHHALPHDLVEQGLIAYESGRQPKVVQYDPSLLAPNPQRGRLVYQHLRDKATSLATDGQQEPIVARLLLPEDRETFPDAFTEEQRLVIVTGHSIFYAQPKSSLDKLAVELMLPDAGENAQAYRRRCLKRATIKLLHSQEYTIVDKANQFLIWCREMGAATPKLSHIMRQFAISKSEAHRIATVAKLEEGTLEKIVNTDVPIADEVIYHIANHAPEEQSAAFKRFSDLPVARVRALVHREGETDVADRPHPGRPRNFQLRLPANDGLIAAIQTQLTPDQWRDHGGADALFKELTRLLNDPDLHDRVERELG